MKKKVILINCIIVISVFVTGLYAYSGSNKKVIYDENNSNIINSNAITMMYETEVDSGEYQVSTDSKWPGDEYIFNESLSRCENGGTLSWNNDTQRIIMQTNTSDKCYVYFDKYNMPRITNVEATEVTSDSITVSVTASSGDGNIISYYYSINNGEYISNENNTYIFENLNAETSYNVSVYANDSNGRKSSVYNVNFVTNKGLISFTIEDITYYAEEGMTWYEWVNSEYNTENFILSCGLPYNDSILSGRYTLVKYGTADLIYSHDIISDGESYSLMNLGPTAGC